MGVSTRLEKSDKNKMTWTVPGTQFRSPHIAQIARTTSPLLSAPRLRVIAVNYATRISLNLSPNMFFIVNLLGVVIGVVTIILLKF